MPLISVVIPAYNQARTLPAVIESVLAQTIRHSAGSRSVEIIVVDDGSTDKTQAVLIPYRKQIHVHYQRRRGLAQAREVGSKIARSTNVIIVNADAVLALDTLNLMTQVTTL
jgi:glycosyltransferase involved in cell wall biosynthesis